MKCAVIGTFLLVGCGVDPTEFNTIDAESSTFQLAQEAEDFGDIQGHRWEQEILEASARGIVEGYPDGNFLPDESISREEMVSALISAIKSIRGLEAYIPEFVDEAPFPDVPATRWSAAVISYARDNQLVAGYPDGLFRPEAQVSRGEVASMVRGMLSWVAILQESGPLSPPIEPVEFEDASSHWAAGDIRFLSASCKAAGPYDTGGLYFRPDSPSSRGHATSVVMIALRCFSI